MLKALNLCGLPLFCRGGGVGGLFKCLLGVGRALTWLKPVGILLEDEAESLGLKPPRGLHVLGCCVVAVLPWVGRGLTWGRRWGVVGPGGHRGGHAHKV